ncbi:MAG TPA: TIGR04283 family arsenosugar biosynthesis glycosyltransferase [Pyrinomonadaceae bacterium]|jgi:rSAM/selenodomain-associated transferase 2|nr:TIGR04283 family arsenosugar biosynthesis glycosyltransferase [Pyrinomonadaceae bacterium]
MSSLSTAERPSISVVIPTLDEAHSLGATLRAVSRLNHGGRVEVIVADGGSADATREIAREHGAHVILSARGRGAQMHAGATVARGDALWFLHADTIPPPDATRLILDALRRDRQIVGGNFAISFDGTRFAARFLTWLYPQLRRLGLCYGDSAIFVRASVYREVGGFKPFPVFEDLDLVRRLRERGTLIHLKARVVTSSRRFEGRSFAFTFARWSFLQMLYWLGVSPHTLSQLYAPVRRGGARAR